MLGPLRIFMLGALLLLSFANVEAQSPIKVDVRAVALRFPDITVDFRVKDGGGRDVIGLEERSIQIIEDGTTIITNFKLERQTADITSPERRLNLSDGKKSEEIYATGATIGVVFDATTLLNDAKNNEHDYLVEGRHAIEQFLLQTGVQAPRDPEAISLFIPTSSPDQEVQPADLAEFTQDRNAVINYLRAMPARTGKTNLYDVIQQAVETTARVARQRGSEPLVLVVSDGGDAISKDSFDRTISQAQANMVKLVTFGIGADKNLAEGGFRLAQLAKTTGGLYLQRPDDAAVSDAFRKTVVAASAALYTARYSTALLDDGRKHHFVVQVTLPDGQATSQPVEFTTLLDADDVSQVIPLGVLLRQYLVIAVPVALLVSLLIVMMMGGIRWARSQSISRAQPSRRKGS